MKMLVETKYFSFDEKIKLENGLEFGPITVAYETYGELNETRDNAILVLHALSGDAHAAGYHSEDDKKPGWWDSMIGPGKPFDTNKYFVICSNFLGGCKGTTGPSSINPATGKPYGMDFPIITVEDMVKVQKKLIDYLGVKKLLSVAGGSLGGMQALEWAIMYPDIVRSAAVIASATKLSAQNIAFNEVGRNAIISDPNWNNGDYYGNELPARGLALARMIGHITYLSEESMHEKFGRKLQDKHHVDFNFDVNFQVESYLRYQGQSFVDRFDANSYLFISKAMDYFDLHEKYGSLAHAFKDSKSKFLFITFTTDWLFPPEELKTAARTIMSLGKEVTYCNIDAPFGHDSFLLEFEHQSRIISNFLAGISTQP
ncbi:MAG: homoserine O-acetyltransferase [Candidatus Melainabacteria bacterium GWF2_37_15]|nr:MAG: homoserine O-acetyltransferase [Candidatus Melainabacteria bacterium GWF2_37_15]